LSIKKTAVFLTTVSNIKIYEQPYNCITSKIADNLYTVMSSVINTWHYK